MSRPRPISTNGLGEGAVSENVLATRVLIAEVDEGEENVLLSRVCNAGFEDGEENKLLSRD